KKPPVSTSTAKKTINDAELLPYYRKATKGDLNDAVLTRIIEAEREEGHKHSRNQPGPALEWILGKTANKLGAEGGADYVLFAGHSALEPDGTVGLDILRKIWKELEELKDRKLPGKAIDGEKDQATKLGLPIAAARLLMSIDEKPPHKKY